jgi:hypothetical protein
MPTAQDGHGHRDEIVADWRCVELDAAWIRETRWERIVTAVMRTRHAVAVVACIAIVAIILVARVRAHDTGILFAAITSIAVVAICTELIGGKYYGQNDGRKGEAQSRDASKNKRTD